MAACLFARPSCPKQTQEPASDVSRSETSTRSRLKAERERERERGEVRLASSSRFIEADASADGG